MNAVSLLSAAGFALLVAGMASAHDACGEPHPDYDSPVKPPGLLLVQAGSPQNRARLVRTNRPAQAAPFEAFAPKVSVRWDERFLFVESNGLPSHNMMVGITNWQQQVPLPHEYTGANSYKLSYEVNGDQRAILYSINADGTFAFEYQNGRDGTNSEVYTRRQGGRGGPAGPDEGRRRLR